MEVKEVVKKLDAVSSCFCLAKWTTVTLHLESGTTHSCHHPKTHVIPLAELKSNPSALHNTKFKIEQRKKMMNGERPAECDYCWRMEDLKSGQISDRILKSESDWSYPYYNEVLQNPLSATFRPRYLEVSFSNACNFKCSYCSADYSTTWEKELNEHGNYYTKSGKKTVKTFVESENPYIAAFWKWWPDIKNDLHTFRITGGEPLLSPNTFRIFDSLIQSPLEKLNLAVNTNLGVPSVLIQKFKNAIVEIETKNAIQQIQVFTSIDAYGERAEYIRNGLNSELFWQNLELILECSQKCNFTIMCTFNALSVTSFIELFEKVDEVNLKYRSEIRKKPVTLDISYLRDPQHQTVKVLPAEFTIIIDEAYQKMLRQCEINMASGGVDYQLEVIKLGRILAWMKEPINPDNKKFLMRQFYLFFTEHDERRGTNFCSIFPEMQAFWEKCRWIAVTDSDYNPMLKKLTYFLIRSYKNLFIKNAQRAKQLNHTVEDFFHITRALRFKIQNILGPVYYFWPHFWENRIRRQVWVPFYYTWLPKPYYFLKYFWGKRIKLGLQKYWVPLFYKVLPKPYYFFKYIWEKRIKRKNSNADH